VESLEKVEVEQKDSANAQPLVLAEAVQGSAPAVNEQMQESLKVLSEETLQLSELIWQESKLVKEFCALLKQVLRQLNISFNLPVSTFPEGRKLQQVILNPEAHLILINDKNEVDSRALEEYSSDIVFSLVSFIIPELSKSLTLFRQRINVRIELFDRVNRELRNLRNMSDSHSDKHEENNATVDDGIKKTLMEQKKNPDQQPTQ
jgi:hypothetical protein